MGLDTSAEHPAPLRVVSQAIGSWLGRLGAVWIEAQVAELTLRQDRAWLTLRDPVVDMSLRASCSRRVLDSMPVPLTEGAQVVVHARPSYYDQRGSLSLHLDLIRPVGLGELLARLEQRRRLLAAEGLFAAERKRLLPFLPERIGLVTGAASAAEHDVLEVTRRRWPGVRFRVEHVRVQGEGAAREVIEAVRRLDADAAVDVIVVARGGGSMEDLLPFSDEGLVRAVSAARTPVVSAIGHEPDNPILDLVADVRAATPSDAAKQVVPDVAEELRCVR
ncbi:MAG: exodeoxyribonuclease VII large subunit, partial [Nocardioidaceae bacterium]|nr:exodeoxyribonuclease VII large subunit [Nocardioidaceae bacterium]